MNAIPASSQALVASPFDSLRFAPMAATARRARPAIRRQFVRLAQCRQSWVRGFIANVRPAHDAQAEHEVDWAEFDAPTFLRRGIVIEGLPDWRGPSSTS